MFFEHYLVWSSSYVCVLYVVTLLLCHQNVQSSPSLSEMWRQALQSSFIMTLCRDEVLNIHQFVTTFFDSMKGYHYLYQYTHTTLSADYCFPARLHSVFSHCSVSNVDLFLFTHYPAIFSSLVTHSRMTLPETYSGSAQYRYLPGGNTFWNSVTNTSSITSILLFL